MPRLTTNAASTYMTPSPSVKISADSAKPTVRRSLRLNGHQAPPIVMPAKRNVVVQIEDPPTLKRRRLARDLPTMRSRGHTATSCVAESHPKKRDSSTSDLRLAHCPPSYKDLDLREQALVKREIELRRRSEDLDGRVSRVIEQEEKTSRLLSQIAEREAKATLFHLEEHFTCPLCYEVMACPISLNPGQCGHTFCAMCVLKWFFSRLHKACGGWHESVDCPICRSLLIITPDRLPRPDITFPFTPNRTVDSVVQNLIDKLAKNPLASVIKEEEDIDGAGLSPLSMKREKETALTCGLDGWRDGGPLKSDWIRRDREGRERIAHITKSWATLTSQEFIELKAKLGV